eukprot:PhF_6_TR40248/c3_g1_i2/m.59891
MSSVHRAPSVLVEVGPVDNPLQPTVIEPSLQHSKFEPLHTNFIQYVQATWKIAVRYLLPSYLYVLISIGPCMAVLVPYLYFGLIPFNIDFCSNTNNTCLQRFEYWRYCGHVVNLFTYLSNPIKPFFLGFRMV